MQMDFNKELAKIQAEQQKHVLRWLQLHQMSSLAVAKAATAMMPPIYPIRQTAALLPKTAQA
jgi:hypothetical protein